MTSDNTQLGDTFRQVALPALAGAAGGGALGAYISSQGEGDPNENPQQRRHRILRNAMISAGLGGMAGATLPMGLKTLAQPYMGSGVTSGPGILDKGVNATLEHAAPIGAAGLGYWKMFHQPGVKNREEAQKSIVSTLGDSSLPQDVQQALKIPKITNHDQVAKLFALGDPGKRHILEQLTGKAMDDTAGTGRLFRAAEIMHEAGHSPPIGISDLQRLFSAASVPKGTEIHPEFTQFSKITDWPEEYSKYLRSGPSMVDKLMGWISKRREMGLPGASGAPAAAEASETIPMLTRVAELYGRLNRPGANSYFRRGLGPLSRLGLLAGGVYAANKFQQKAMGN